MAREERVVDEPLIHVGFHKTASTFLQDGLFRPRDAADAADPAFELPPVPRHQIVHDLVMPDPLLYDADAAQARYAPAFAAAAERGRTPVLSHERLSGYPSGGGRDRAEIAERLARTWPEARILMVVREQRSLIRSMYSQHITDGGVEGLARFLATPEPGLGRRPAFGFACYEFDRLVARYHALFGAERVLVLPFETLAADPSRFLARICAFCGRPPVAPPRRRSNTARPLLMQALQRPLNFLFYHNELSPGALLHVSRFHKRYARLLPLMRAVSPAPLERRLDARLRARIAEAVGERYAESNARTAVLIGEPLGDLGYPVAPMPPALRAVAA